MSLLLDALKRAEAERAGKAPPASGLTEPMVAPPPVSTEVAKSALPLELLSLADAPAAATAPATRAADPLDQRKGLRRATDAGADHRPSDTAAASREQVRTVFAAKAPTRVARPFPVVPLLLVLGLLLLCSGAAYVWLQMRSLTVPVPASRPASPPAPSPVAATAPLAPGPDAAPTPQAGLPPVLSTAPPPSATSSAPPPSLAVASVPAGVMRASRPVRDAASAVEREPAPLRVQPTTPRRILDPAVSEGYEALTRGDLVAARGHYEAALRRDPANLDALLGAATIAARQDNPTEAARHYREALAVDPLNGTARAGLAALASTRHTPGEGDESQLRAELQRASEATRAPLYTALGNLLATGNRWAEAQTAYYEAFRLDADNPDVLHNLAVSLDHLRQSRIAADFYARALKAAERRPAQFDPRAVRTRLAQLG